MKEKPVYAKRWLVLIIWGLSCSGILTGIASTVFHFWMIGKKLGVYGNQPRLALNLDIWLIVLLNVAFWTALAATVCSVGLWLSSGAPRRAKVSGAIAVTSAWVGIVVLFVWHDVRL